MSDVKPPRPNQILLVAVIFEGGLGVLAWGLGALGVVDVRPLEQIRWETPAAIWGVAATVPLVLVLIVSMRYPSGPLQGLKRTIRELVVPIFKDCSVLHLALISALAGVGEEMLFRGVIQPVAIRWLSTWTRMLFEGLIQLAGIQWLGTCAGVAAASIIFGLAHPISKTYVVAAALIGVYLGVILIATENLLAPILVHGLYDFVVLVYLLRTNRVDNSQDPHPPST